jgi:hypothetical protein
MLRFSGMPLGYNIEPNFAPYLIHIPYLYITKQFLFVVV